MALVTPLRKVPYYIGTGQRGGWHMSDGELVHAARPREPYLSMTGDDLPRVHRRAATQFGDGVCPGHRQ